MSEPRIDILMAIYNGERFVGEQIEPIQAQTYGNWRLLVSDGCSCDGTLDVVHRYAVEDERIRIVSEGVRYSGAKENFSALMSKTDAPYVMFCDQDDVWLLEKIKLSLAKMHEIEKEHDTCVPTLVFTDTRVVDASLETVSESFERNANLDLSRVKFAQFVTQNAAAGCTMMLNRPLVDICSKGTGCPEIIMHDRWALLGAAAFGNISYIDAQLSLYRQHGDNECWTNAYSPIDRALHRDHMEDQFRQTIKQADVFGKTYEGLLDDDISKCIAA